MRDLTRKEWTFGMADEFMSLLPNDVAYLNAVLQDHTAIRLVIELGTYFGGSAYMWATAMALRGGRVLTFDNASYDRPYQASFPSLCGFILADVKQEATQALIQIEIQQADGPVLLFCDNGDKPYEVATYWSMLRPGDVLAVHDWLDDNTAEIGPHTAPAMLDAALWEPVRQECWSPAMIARAWKRTEAPA